MGTETTTPLAADSVTRHVAPSIIASASITAGDAVRVWWAACTCGWESTTRETTEDYAAMGEAWTEHHALTHPGAHVDTSTYVPRQRCAYCGTEDETCPDGQRYVYACCTCEHGDDDVH